MFCDHLPACAWKQNTGPCDCGVDPKERAFFFEALAEIKELRALVKKLQEDRRRLVEQLPEGD
jgi:hypothetical protein